MLGGFARGRLRKRTCLRLFLASGPLGATCPGRGGPDPRRGSGAASMWRNVVIVIQRLMVRTQGGPLRPVWAALYTAVMHLVAAYLCYGHKGAAVYVCRSLAIDKPIYGVSDIDLVVVIPGAKDRNGTESERHRSRWRHLCRLVPPLRDLLPDVAFYEEAELREATRGPVLTYGLDRGVQGHTDRAAFWGPGAPADEFGLRSRPGLYGPTSDWRPIRGPDRRPRVDAPDRQERRI